jgi:3-hydroxyisobutyrate dehydrogenase-like beta-hydroxyacid dehydrogenase
MNVAIFGLGIIGGVWAANLRADGFRVRGWNRTPKTFEGFVPDAAAAARESDLLIICVADPAAVQSVLDLIRPALTSRHLVVQSSTVGPDDNRRFAAFVNQSGARFLEAPFTGSKPAAEQRKTVFYVGGDAADVEAVRPVLARLSQAIQHIGPVGAAAALKLAMNINVALVGEALGESLAYARAMGLSDDKFFEGLKLNVSRSGLVDLKEAKLRQSDFRPQFSVKHMAKDLRLAVASAGPDPLPQTRAALELYDEALRRGWGDEDFITLIRLLLR